MSAHANTAAGAANATAPGPDHELLTQLASGELHRFADHASLGGVIPAAGAGVYTIRDESGSLV